MVSSVTVVYSIIVVSVALVVDEVVSSTLSSVESVVVTTGVVCAVLIGPLSELVVSVVDVILTVDPVEVIGSKVMSL